jgi:hypothetical protein
LIFGWFRGVQQVVNERGAAAGKESGGNDQRDGAEQYQVILMRVTPAR